MKTTILVSLMAAMLALPAAGALIAADLATTDEKKTPALLDELIDEDVDFEPEIAELLGCDGVNLYADDEGNAAATFYKYVEDEETGEIVQEECDPLAGAFGTLPAVSVMDEIINEDTDFEPEVAGLVGCDGLNLYADDEGNAAATFYKYVEDEETGEIVQEECDPLALGAMTTGASQDELINEDSDFEPEIAELVGCDGVNLYADDEGNAVATFYKYVEDEETGEIVQEECDPLAV